MKQQSLLSLDPHGFHRLAYTGVGRPRRIPACWSACMASPATGRDFDYLAEKLSDTYRVVCPDCGGGAAKERLAARERPTMATRLYLNDPHIATLMAKLGRRKRRLGGHLDGRDHRPC